MFHFINLGIEKMLLYVSGKDFRMFLEKNQDVLGKVHREGRHHSLFVQYINNVNVSDSVLSIHRRN